MSNKNMNKSKGISLIIFTTIFTVISSMSVAISFNMNIYSNNPKDIMEIFGTIPINYQFLILIPIYILIIKKSTPFNFGFNLKTITFNRPIFWMTLLLILSNFIFNDFITLFTSVDYGQLFSGILFSFIGAALVGISEELYLRGGLFNLFLGIFHNKTKNVLYAAVCSSLIFGLFHLVNLSSGQDILTTLVQIIFAFFFGLTASFVYYKTQNIIIPIISHTLINTSAFFFEMSNSQKPMIVTILMGLAFIIVSATASFFAYKEINGIEQNTLGTFIKQAN